MAVPVLLVVNALIRLASAASGQMFAFVVATRLFRVGNGAALVGVLGASFFATELLGAPVAGRIADARGQYAVLRFGPAFGALCGGAAAFTTLRAQPVAPLIVTLLVARMLEGLSAACAVPTTLTLLSRATDGDAARRTRVMALFEITSLLAMISGFAVAGVAWDAWHAHAFLVLPAIYGLAALLLAGARAPEPAARANRPRAGHFLALLARERGNVGFAIAWLSVNAVVGVWMQHAPYLFKLPERSATQALVGGYSGREIAMIFTGWGVTFLAGLAGWAVLAPRASRRKTLRAALVAMLGVSAALAALNHGAGRWTLAVGVICILVESGFTPAALAHLADVTERHQASRSAALGVYSLVLGTGQLIGNALGAVFVSRWQMDGALLLTALLATTALGAVATMPRDTPVTQDVRR